MLAKNSDTAFDQIFFNSSGSGCFAIAQTDKQTDTHTHRRTWQHDKKVPHTGNKESLDRCE